VATLFWAGEGEVIRIIMNHEFTIDADKMAIFGLVWFFLMSITYGTNVPSGLFLPGMIVGCAVGDLSARAV